jgi:N utilization substance protein B
LNKRRKSREFALQVLYQWEITKQDVSRAMGQAAECFPLEKGEVEFAERLVRGVMECREKLDEVIEAYSEHWRLERMSIVDRNILRIAAFELLHCPDIPPKVTLNEAIDLGKRFGTEDSGGFINGILDRILSEVVRKLLEPTKQETE